MTAIVGWTLVHFLWQGALVGAAVALLLALVGRGSPTLRYGLCLGGLLGMVALPATTLVRFASSGSSPGAGWYSVEPLTVPEGRESPAAPEAAAFPGDAAGIASGAAAGSKSGGAAGARGTPVPALRRSVRAWIDRSAPWLVGIWLLGVLGLTLRLLGGWAWARRLVRSGTRPAPEVVRGLVEPLAARLRVSRPIRLLESTLIQVPAVVGALRPALLVPASLLTGLTPAQLEVLLAHELAHVRRHDYLVNLLQSVVETLLFYHPMVWWVSRKIREEREHCCDDLALSVCGDRELYVGALLELERLRGSSLGLAAAASGGSLVGRVRRLLTPAPSHDGGGPRWVAGAVVVALVLVIGGGTTLSRATTTRDAVDPSSSGAGKDVTAPQAKEIKNTERLEGPAIPDTVIRFTGTGPLAERLTWAGQQARRAGLDRYWIGYVIPEGGERGWFYHDRYAPIALSGGSILSGHLHFRGELGDFRAPGVPLEELVGAQDPTDVVILLGYTVEAGRPVLDRVRLSHTFFPVHLGGRSLVWLGPTSQAESVEAIVQLYQRAPAERLREDLVAMVGVHAQAPGATPALVRWLRTDGSDQIRAEAAEGLAWQTVPAALAALARAAREDRSSQVRGEAAEAIGDIALPTATDTLIVLARTLEDRHARSEAVEALGARPEPEAVEALVGIARDDPATDIQREAVETLGEVKGGLGVRPLREIAASHPKMDVRREAVATLAQALKPEEALEVLPRIAREDPSQDIRREAVETLGELHDERVLALLESIARSERDEDVAREAVETLGQLEPSRRVADLLVDLARNHPSVAVQREAVETLGEMHDGDPAALEHVAGIARTHPRSEVRREAIETYADHASPRDAAALLTAILRSATKPSLQGEALERLADLPEGAGIPAVLEVARGNPDRRLRLKAIEALGESDDPRARALLEQILSRP